MTYSRVPVPEPSPSRVLLVDDDRSVRHALYTLLESEGYEVLAAGNGLDGLAIFRQSIRPIELLVTDYNMPRMSGLELARECSRIRCELCVLYVSGAHPDEQLRADLYEPKRAFLAKPFRTDDLLRKARELLLEPPRQLSPLDEAIGFASPVADDSSAPLARLPPSPFRSFGGYFSYEGWSDQQRFMELDEALRRKACENPQGCKPKT